MKRTQRGWNSTLRPGKPLGRKTPIRPTTKPVDRSNPVRQVSRQGAGSEATWQTWRKHNRDKVRARRLCEECGREGEHVHHTFGRLGEPWASSWLVCVYLCFACHAYVHRANSGNKGYSNMRDRLRRVGLIRLREWLDRELGPHVWLDKLDDPDDLRSYFRYAVAVAQAYGISPPGFKEDKHGPQSSTTQTDPGQEQPSRRLPT